MAVVDAFESGIVDLPNFYFTGDDYGYRFEPEAKKRFLDLLRERFNSGVGYNGRVLKWDTVIEQKTAELGRYPVGKSRKLNFSEPAPTLSRIDDRELREEILNLSGPEARRLGIGKSTFHYLRTKARMQRRLRIYDKVREKLEPVALTWA
jgi:hypothetical protein